MILPEWIAGLGEAALRFFWLPLLGWTVAAGVLLLVLRLWRRLHPEVQYQARTVLLLVLPLGLLGAVVIDGTESLLPVEATRWAVGAAEVTGYLVERTGEAEAQTFIAKPAGVLMQAKSSGWWLMWGVLTLGFGVGALLGLLRLARQRLDLRRLQETLDAIDVSTVRAALGDQPEPPVLVNYRVRYARSVDGVPLTFGWRTPVIVLPKPVLANPDQLAAVLLHEGVHIERRDYVQGWLEAVVGAVFWMHPLVALLRRQIARLREITCDGRVVASGQVGAQQYAAVLVALATGRPAPVLAHSIITASTTLRARLLALYEQRRVSVVSLLLVAGAMFSITLLATMGPRVAPAEQLPQTMRLQIITEQAPQLQGPSRFLSSDAARPDPHKFTLLKALVNGEEVLSGGGSTQDIRTAYMAFTIGNDRRMVLAGQQFSGATATARLQSSRVLLARYQGHEYLIESAEPILSSGQRKLWVRVVPQQGHATTLRIDHIDNVSQEW